MTVSASHQDVPDHTKAGTVDTRASERADGERSVIPDPSTSQLTDVRGPSWVEGLRNRRVRNTLLGAGAELQSPISSRGGARLAGKFEVYEDKSGKFRFRLKAGNGEVVAQGQSYESKAGAHAGCAAVQRAAADAAIVDVDE